MKNIETSYLNNVKMSKEEFKRLWESGGDAITYSDIMNCAVEWGLYEDTDDYYIYQVQYDVLLAAGCKDAHLFNPMVN